MSDSFDKGKEGAGERSSNDTSSKKGFNKIETCFFVFFGVATTVIFCQLAYTGSIALKDQEVTSILFKSIFLKHFCCGC